MKDKLDEQGSIAHYRARIVAKSEVQKGGADYAETPPTLTPLNTSPCHRRKAHTSGFAYSSG